MERERLSWSSLSNTHTVHIFAAMSAPVSFGLYVTPQNKRSHQVKVYEPGSILNFASRIAPQFTQAQNDKAEHSEVASVRSNAPCVIEQLHPDSKGLAPIGEIKHSQ